MNAVPTILPGEHLVLGNFVRECRSEPGNSPGQRSDTPLNRTPGPSFSSIDASSRHKQRVCLRSAPSRLQCITAAEEVYSLAYVAGLLCHEQCCIRTMPPDQ